MKTPLIALHSFLWKNSFLQAKQLPTTLMRQISTVYVFLSFALAAKAQVVINEIGIAPAVRSSEFIELYNKSSCAIDLSCYTLVYSSTSGSGNATGWTVKIPMGNTIAACGYFLIGGSAGATGVANGTGYPTGGKGNSYPAANLDIASLTITANAVFMKRGVNAGKLTNTSGQLTLLNSAGAVVSSVTYNNGNNSNTYPLSAYTTCNLTNNTQGSNNIPDPGASANNVNGNFTSVAGTGKYQGIYLDASGIYQKENSLSPGVSNLSNGYSQTSCDPSMITAAPTVNITQPTCTVTTGNITVTSPLGMSYSIDGMNYQSSNVFDGLAEGSYSVTVKNNAGCISQPLKIKINLPVKATMLTMDSIGCGSVIFRGTNYTTSAVVKDTVRSVINGCDSLIYITNIIIKPMPVTNINICLPQGGSYDFNGQTLTASGHYETTIAKPNQCDSMVHLLLIISTSEFINLSGCNWVSYRGVSYTSSTTLYESIPSQITGCDSILRTIHIAVNEKPQISVSPDKFICKGASATLNAWAANTNISWIGIGTGSTITISPGTTTTYTAIAISANGCKDTANVTVNVQNFNLLITANPNPVIAGSTTHLQSNAATPYQILAWKPSVLFSNPIAVSQNLVADTSITVMAIARSFTGCIDTATITIMVDPAGNDIFIPSAFTPNGDGKNDVFKVLGGNIREFDMKIFNRWGQMIFSSNHRTKGWDGSFAGKEQPGGAYVYAISAVLKNGTVVNKKGTIMLIR